MYLVPLIAPVFFSVWSQQYVYQCSRRKYFWIKLQGGVAGLCIHVFDEAVNVSASVCTSLYLQQVTQAATRWSHRSGHEFYSNVTSLFENDIRRNLSWSWTLVSLAVYFFWPGASYSLSGENDSKMTQWSYTYQIPKQNRKQHLKSFCGKVESIFPKLF